MSPVDIRRGVLQGPTLTMQSFSSLFPGDPAPWFRQRCTTPQGTYTFDMCAGRHVLLYFFASSLELGVGEELSTIKAQAGLFGGGRASFFGVTSDEDDEIQARLAAAPEGGIRFFWDSDGLIGRLYGARATDETVQKSLWILLDPMLRVLAVAVHQPGMAACMATKLRDAEARAGATASAPAPVLSLDHVFEPEFCLRLIDYFKMTGSVESGVFTQAEGRSITIADSSFKRRRDCAVRDPVLMQQVQARIIRRVVPEIRKAFQFEASRLERLIIACYSANDRGCFGPHRDNTVDATAHRRFAVSINLNSDFEGGDLTFPEFGRNAYRPSAGGALVFSCSLMHTVMPVTKGQRFACLPFVYDEAASRIKQANRSASQSHATASS